MEKALSVSEIRSSISLFLDTPALQACALVSRAWNESLAPILWRDLTFGPCKDNGRHSSFSSSLHQDNTPEAYSVHSSLPPLARILAYQRYIQSLTLLNVKVADLALFPPEGFSQLKRFTFGREVQDGTQDEVLSAAEGIESLDLVATVLEANRHSIREVRLQTPGLRPTKRLWKALRDCTRLESLYVSDIVVEATVNEEDKENDQWKVLSTVKTLGYKHWDCAAALQDFSAVNSLPNITRLLIDEPVISCTPAFLMRCLRLQALEFPPCGDVLLHLSRDMREEIEEARGQGGWKDLDTFKFLPGTAEYEIEHFSGVLEAMVPNKLVHLKVDRIRPQSRVYYALARHYRSLTHLDIASSKAHHNRTLHILTACPVLEFFRGGDLSMDDFAEPLTQAQTRGSAIRNLHCNSQPWICTGLKFLEIHFFTNRPLSHTQIRSQAEDGSWSYRTLTQADFDRKEAEEGESPDYPRPLKRHYRALFTELARLTQLETLLIRHRNHSTGGTGAPMAMDMRLGTGMDLLGTLTRLRRLSIQRYCYMDVEDAKWMVEHWKGLEVLDLSLSQGPKGMMGYFGEHWEAEKVLEVWRTRGIRV